MQTAIPLDKMTVPDKLRTIEDIWCDLQGTPDDVPSPAWHADVFLARENRVREGSSQFGGWSEAKCRIREQTR
jgi:hypothetical protein